MSFDIRDAALGDLEAIVDLINEAYLLEAFFVSGPRTDRQEIAAKLDAGTFLISEDSRHRLAGCVYLEVDSDPAYVGLVSVAPAAQGAGLGKRLMAAAEDRARRRGCREISLLTVDLREELPPWYRGQGYREVGIEPFNDTSRLLRPCHFVRMTKRL